MPAVSTAASNAACGGLAGPEAAIISGWFQPGDSNIPFLQPTAVYLTVDCVVADERYQRSIPHDRDFDGDSTQTLDVSSVVVVQK